jgi:hypothetical protein
MYVNWRSSWSIHLRQLAFNLPHVLPQSFLCPISHRRRCTQSASSTADVPITRSVDITEEQEPEEVLRKKPKKARKRKKTNYKWVAQFELTIISNYYSCRVHIFTVFVFMYYSCWVFNNNILSLFMVLT